LIHLAGELAVMAEQKINTLVKIVHATHRTSREATAAMRRSQQEKERRNW
jgi:hypothetical protein